MQETKTMTVVITLGLFVLAAILFFSWMGQQLAAGFHVRDLLWPF